MLSKNRIHVPGFFLIPFVFPYDIIHRVFVSLNEQSMMCDHKEKNIILCAYTDSLLFTLDPGMSPSTHSNRCAGCSVMSAFDRNLSVTIKGRKIQHSHIYGNHCRGCVLLQKVLFHYSNAGTIWTEEVC